MYTRGLQRSPIRRQFSRATALSVALAAALAHGRAEAQVATDGTLGPRMTLNGPNYVVGPGIGRPSGANLFHSFATLNVHSGQSIRFLGGSGIANIIARVTGGSASTFDGLVGSTPGVNLYLLNPAGMFFGPGAALDLTGSFYASTAHHLNFSDGARFSVTSEAPPLNTLLPFQAPASFTFDGPSGLISLTGSQLVVRNGASLGLFGGDIRMTNAGTRLSILSVLGGTAAVAAAGGALDIALDGKVSGGIASGRFDARVTRGGPGAGQTEPGGSIIAVNENASGNGGGRIVIRGGDVYFEKGQLLANSRLGDGRGIDIEASGLLTVKGTSILSLTTGRGNAGSIDIRARDMVMEDLSAIDASCDPGCTTGRGGDVNVDVQRSLMMKNDPKNGDAFIGSNSFGAGDTGRVTVKADSIVMEGAVAIQAVALSSGASQGLTVNADTLMLRNGAQIDTSSRGAGRGGTLVINAHDILLVGDRLTGSRLENEREVLNRQSIPSGFFSNAYSSGFAGSVTVNTGSLRVMDGAEISSSSARRATGLGGLIRIIAAGDVIVSGVSKLNTTPKPSAIVSNTFTSGDSGIIEIHADRVQVLDRGLIQTQSEGSGIAGDIRIRVRDMDVLGGQVSSDARAFGRGGSIDIGLAGTLSIARTDPNAFAGLFARAYSAGAGGAIRIRARDLRLSSSGEINAGTIGAGRGGDIDIGLDGRLTMESGGKVSSESDDALGEAGNVAIRAAQGVSLANASIFGRAKASDGGSVLVSTQGQFTMDRTSEISAESRAGAGAGGNVELQAGSFVQQGGRVSASSAGGTGGNLAIRATGSLAVSDGLITAQVASGNQGGGNITLSGGSMSIARSLVTANAFSGDGGVIRLTSPGMIDIFRSGISADVASGSGGGGNIGVSGGSVLVRETHVSASTFGGSGGSLRLASEGELRVERTLVEAQVVSESGAGGNIALEADRIHLVGSNITASALSGEGGNASVAARALNAIAQTRISAEVLTGSGGGGNLQVSGGSLALVGSAVSANAFSGAGGVIRLSSPGWIDIAQSVISADVASGTGSGGNISLDGGGIGLQDSLVTASTFGGSGGSLRLTSSSELRARGSRIESRVVGDAGAGGNITLDAGAIRLSESVVSASALSGDGGNMILASKATNIVEHSRISAEVLTGLGDGGNLDLQGGALLLRDSTVSANAFGGRGGNILIDSDNILTNPASRVTASSELGIDGTVVFSSPAADLSGALFAVSSSFQEAGVAQGGVCAMPRARGRASLALRLIDADFGRDERFLFPAMSADPARAGAKVIAQADQGPGGGQGSSWLR